MSEWNGFDVLKNYEKSKSNVNDEIDLNIEYYPRLSNRSGKGGTEVGWECIEQWASGVGKTAKY